jgi:hypothetical protein
MKMSTSLLTALFVLVISFAASAQPPDSADRERQLSNAGYLVALIRWCPSHVNSMPPKKQDIMASIIKQAVSEHGIEAVQKAHAEAYEKGYYEKGERWCHTPSF